MLYMIGGQAEIMENNGMNKDIYNDVKMNDCDSCWKIIFCKELGCMVRNCIFWQSEMEWVRDNEERMDW